MLTTDGDSSARIGGYGAVMSLRYVDPHRRRGRGYRVGERFGRSPAGQWFARRVSTRLDPVLYRATGGRFTTSMGVVVNAPLVTIGARSGQPREVQLTYFHDGPDPILIASNFGGTKHPAWYYNLKGNPQCRFGGEDFLASEVTDPDEHARLYALAEQVYAGYGDYLAKTAPHGRRIPLFRLRAAE
jgi:deazaflavin-dependent oxidoreductase (nitroreductase family)